LRERKERGISQLAAAETIGIAQATYAGWEIGRSTPSGATLCGVAAFLGIPTAEVEELATVPFTVNTSQWPAVGRLIGGRRAALRMTRAELARSLSVSAATVTAWELGHRTPRAQQVGSLAATLDVPVADLVDALPLHDQLSALGRLIRSRQQQLGLRLSEIASRAEVNESTLSRWLHGHRTPAVSSLSRLAVALELPFPVVREAANLSF